MDTNNNTLDKIELRSEKVRKLLGEIPQSLVRWGMVIMLVIFIALLALVCLLPYPYSNGESIIGTVV